MLTRTTAIITGTGEVRTREEPVPALPENEVRIRVRCSLISPGTEITSIRERRAKPQPETATAAFGYANAGEVIEVNGDGKGLQPGMRVAAMGAGYALHASYVNVPVNLVVPIPDTVTYAQASYACLGATALHAVHRTAPQLGEFGVVLGLGIVGNLAAQLSCLSGARVVAWERMTARARIAEQCGIGDCLDPGQVDCLDRTRAFAAPGGLDFGIMAFGGPATDALTAVMSCMKLSADGHRMGRITLVGGCEVTLTGGAASGNLDIRSAARTGPGYHDPAYEHGQDYPAAFVPFTTADNLREIIRLIAEGRLIVDPLTTHRKPLAEVAEAVELLIDHPDRALGVILEPAT